MARGNSWAIGTTIFAATMMIVIGVFQFFQGLAAVIKDQFFVVTPNYTYEVDTTAWGWIHMGLGAVLLLTGLFLFTGATWARVVGIGLVALSAIANFFFVPYYPLWSLLIIALDVVIIWALATAGRRVGAEGPPMGYTPQHTGDQTMQDTSRWPATNQPTSRTYAGEPPKAPVDRTGAMSEQERAMSGADRMREQGMYAQEQAQDAAEAARRRTQPPTG